MATIARTSAANRGAPDPTRKTALVAGILYLLTFASSIPAALLLGSTLDTPGYILGAGADGQVRLAGLLDIVNGLTAIGTAVALYSVVKRQHEGFAIGFVASRLFEAAILFVGVLSVITIANLRETGAAAADPAALGAVGTSLVALYKTSFVLGTGIPALNAVFLGWLMYRSGLVPRIIPVIGLIGAPLFTSWIIGYIFGITEGGTPWHAIGVAPIFIWELALGLWMTFKGFNRSAPIVLAAAAEATSQGGSATPSPAPVGVAAKAGAA
ncbi:MAG: DUF4386 domain-containing protein [Chloroflexi bacterium]|nr:DUF4386 domain-containing protein [Chloroflexota bacterium]